MNKIGIGLIAGAFWGILMSNYFVNEFTFEKVIYTKITLTTIIAGICCGIYAIKAKRAFNLFLGCILISVAVFYIKYLITNHYYDPINMGTFVGALLGFLFYIMKKINDNPRIDYRK